ncbi:BnaC03g17360D [Brassica napus]|uniref:BnaC03g17360D protein n=1 Tax=Brassica napus TaxID=3708 RepID=A0A078GBV8_BRANA|nr:BnaC03g17360D [Brassica napus]
MFIYILYILMCKQNVDVDTKTCKHGRGERFEKSQWKRKRKRKKNKLNLSLSLLMALSGNLQLTSNYIPDTEHLLYYLTLHVWRNNPDFSRNNRNGFRGRNRRNEDRDGLDGGGGGLEDSEMLSSKNEKEIVNLFRKVQAQLRARAAAKKEDKKTEEASKGQGGKETETVDSLLKLLRKHSGEQSKKNVSNFDSEKQLQGDDDDDAERQVHSSNNFDSRNRDHNATRFTRPASSFRRNSPVPRHKPQSSYSSEAIFDEASSYSVTWTQKKDQVVEPEPEYEPGLALLESEPELKPESFYDEEDEDHDVLVGELSNDDDESVNAEEETEKNEDLSALKLIELRAIAKSRGLKGISKMKKTELLNLLCSNKA